MVFKHQLIVTNYCRVTVFSIEIHSRDNVVKQFLKPIEEIQLASTDFTNKVDR